MKAQKGKTGSLQMILGIIIFYKPWLKDKKLENSGEELFLEKRFSNSGIILHFDAQEKMTNTGNYTKIFLHPYN